MMLNLFLLNVFMNTGYDRCVTIRIPALFFFVNQVQLSDLMKPILQSLFKKLVRLGKFSFVFFQLVKCFFKPVEQMSSFFGYNKTLESLNVIFSG